MVLVFPIRFMKLLLLLHQHVPFLSKKILHSVPFCRTSHVQFLLGSLALCVALSLTLAHVHFRTVIERMCLCPSYCWDRHSSLRPCYFCFFSSWSSGNNGCSEGVVVVLVEQDVIIKGYVSSVWKKVVVAESDCGCWNLQNQFQKEICMQVQNCCLPEEIAREIQCEECQFALCWHSFKPLLSEVVIYMHSWTNPHNNTNVPERKTKIRACFSLLKNNTCIQSSNPSLLLLVPLFLSSRR